MSCSHVNLGVLAVLAVLPSRGLPQQPDLLPANSVQALARELSGETARRDLEYLARLHRMAGSPDFHEAIRFLAERARAAGLREVRVDSFPTDGQRFYGTQRSRPAWAMEAGELWELARDGAVWRPAVRIASWDAMPITIANMSEGGEVEAELVDVGDGTTEGDYADKEVRGRLILAAQQPGAVAPLGIARYGALGIVSSAQNQRTAWWGEDENLVRWGHYDAFAPFNRLGFMVSLKQARAWQRRLAAGETVRLRAWARGGRRPGYYEVLTASIPGADPALRSEEIAFSCHLDHQRPGANDNASGCVAILEVARAVARLVDRGDIPPPARTLRFIWPPEIEGTLALLVSRAEQRDRIKAVVHMDMVGGGPVTKAIFRVTRGPGSLPSFVNDVAQAWGEVVNRESAAFASGRATTLPLAAPEGGKEAFAALLDDFSLGSDHEVYTEGSFGIPAIYLNQWPDRYIHTNADRAANIDPTVLKRAAFIGAASGLSLAGLRPEQAPALWRVMAPLALRRTGTMLARRADLEPAEAAALTRFHWWFEARMVGSIERFFPLPPAVRAEAAAFHGALQRATGRPEPGARPAGALATVYQRNPDLRGPMSAFGYDYLSDHYGAERVARLGLLSFQGHRGGGGDYAYEVLNFVDGTRSVAEIRDLVSAIYGPVPVALVSEYLEALEAIDVVRRRTVSTP